MPWMASKEMLNFNHSHGVTVLGVVINGGPCKQGTWVKEPKIRDLSHMMFALGERGKVPPKGLVVSQ